MLEAEAASVHCPNCQQIMQSREIERRDGGKLKIDMCFPCYAIWFDHWESIQLAPSAIIELFREIHNHRDEARHSFANSQSCPRCSVRLALTNDLCKTGRFSYYRCPQGHGRLTPFFQFLREKQFVRTLTPGELSRVRAEIKEVKCSSCGAAVDLEQASECGYCKSPIAVLDADAVEKAIQFWSRTEAKQHQPDPQTVSDALKRIDAMGMSQKQNASYLSPLGQISNPAVSGSDLLEIGIDVLGIIFDSMASE